MNDMYTRAPHRRPSADMADAAALLIDFDNVTMGIRSNLGQELRNFLDSDIIRGKVAVQRAYADWRRYPQYIVPLSESSVDLIFAPAYGSSKKNATDIRLAIDALELVFTRPEIGTFILLSGDSDFSSLVLKLKEYGKYVIGVGLQESTSDILVQNCDEYYSYNRLSGLTAADELQTEKHDPWELTSRAVARMAERGDVMRSDRLKQVMLEMDPGFDEKTAGFSRFNRFLSEAAKRNRIVLQKRENGQYDVGLPSGAASAAGGDPVSSRGEAATAKSRSRRGRRGGRGRASAPKAPEERAPAKAGKPSAKTTDSSAAAVEGAYEALKRAVAELSRDGAPVRDSMAKRKLLQYDAAFDEGVFGFSKFSLFLRAAHDAGVVRMSRHEDGNHYLTATAAPAAPAVPARKAEPAPDGSPDEAGGRSPLSAAARAARKTLDRLRRGPAPRHEAASPGKPASRSEAAPRSEPAPRSKPAPRQEPVPRSAPSSRAAGADAPGQRKRPAQQRKAESARPERGGKDPSGARGAKTAAKGRADQGPADQGRPDRRGGSSAERRRQPKAREQRKRDAGPNREEAAPKQPAASAPKREPETRDSQPSAREKTSSRRTLGRYRSGSRGRTAAPSAAKKGGAPRIGLVADDEAAGGEAKKDAKIEDVPTRDRPAARKTGGAGKSAGGTAKPAARSAAKPAGGPIGHMVRNYAGVGKRTAEVLFDHFGDRVFDVIDSEPARLTEVLSEGRAKVVREARRAELES
ncbi:NYN domain-containing protein [Candidatus Palauibacter polyketidifaciens]|uniref:NYN domain-containing protein n=1 Tax=Candidatus Palauibacter polyketidifaciens TaxID=3056740 RepID=UPI00139B8EE4|nr:NYN domain-containing protein [Candidatus Palauibacter polyketidifaciens]MDE2719866.1 NYN domain-containing protein [Candidatus Palauibacter polyketidifaciens]MYE35804.1 NYN domain-containing protein [Gemmatimonadales bacterium]